MLVIVGYLKVHNLVELVYKKEMTMNLVERVTIIELLPIKDADRIEIARVLGWDAIVRKGVYSVEDECLFVFPDTIVPKSLLDVTYTGDERIRLKVIKMKGQYSAGLILPLSTLTDQSITDPDELAKILNIEKYVKELSACLSGDAKGNFPTVYIAKTDEDNLKSNPRAIEELCSYDGDIVMTLKIDGTSTTVIRDYEDFRVCSRNLELKPNETSVYWMMVEKYKLQEKLMALDHNYAIQFETYGQKINGNALKMDTIDMMVFHVKDLTDKTFLNIDETYAFCLALGIPMVPILRTFSNDEFVELVTSREIFSMVNALKYPKGDPAEGAVFKTSKVMHSYSLQKSWWSVKIINDNYKD